MRNIRETLVTWAVMLSAALLPCGAARAEMPQPIVAYCYPAGGQQGTVVDVTVTGQNLHGVREARCGGRVEAKLLKAMAVPPEKNRSSQSLTVNSAATVSLTIPSDAPAGFVDLRLVSDGGVSNRARFQIGSLGEHREQEPNSRLDQAETLTALPVVVNGQLAEGDRDFYRFAAKAGETMVCRTEARALLPFLADGVPGWNDACLTLYEAGGAELGTLDDVGSNPDPVLTFQVLRDGDYVLEVRDVLLRGRGDFVYRLSVGRLPQVTRIFPLGGRRGTVTKVQLWGVNLPAELQDVALAADCPAVRPVKVDGAPACNAPSFAAGDYPEVLEVEPNNSAATAQRVACPAVVNGRLDAAGDEDRFVVTVSAGQKLVLEVQARRLGSPVDSILSLYSRQEAKLAENDDFADAEAGTLTHQADSRIIQTFAAAGDYVLLLRDVQGKGGAAYAYRLIVAPAIPDFELRVMPDNPRAARGDHAVVSIQAVRKDGFAQAINITAEGLPPGAVAGAAVIPPGADRVSFTISIPPDVAAGVLSPRIVGAATVGGQAVTRVAQPAEEMTQAFSSKHVMPTQELALAIFDSAPFALALVEPPAQPVEVRQGREMELRVRAVRPPGEAAPIFVRLYQRTPGVNLKMATIAPEETEATLTLSITRQAPAGQPLNLILVGSTRFGKEQITRVLPEITIMPLAAPAGPAGRPNRPARDPADQPSVAPAKGAASSATKNPADSAAKAPAKPPVATPAKSAADQPVVGPAK